MEHTSERQQALAAISAEDFVPLEENSLDREAIVRPSVRYWPDVWRRLRQNRMAMFCLALIGLMILMAIFVPIVSPYSFDQTNLSARSQRPSAKHWFGTDSVGRDMFTRVWYGSRVSLAIGFIGAILPYAIGMLVGGIAGWFGGWVDMLIMRLIDVGLCIPQMIYIILIMIYLGGGPDSLVIALAAIGWMGSARGFRGRVLQFKNREFTLTARALGASPLRIIFRHILPNIMGNMAVGLSAAVPAAIFMEAGLSFVGLGVKSPDTSLGQLASEGAGYFRTQPHLLVCPSIVISLIIFAFFMFGNCLRDALDPHLRDKEVRKGAKRA
jgi:oligopeptide transport system permease protein